MESKWDLVVIGLGSAGLVAANVAAGLGLRVAGVDGGHVGGECLWSGCVPSKALIHAASVAHLTRQGLSAQARDNGAIVGGSEALQYVRRVRGEISAAESPEALREHGIEFFVGHAQLEPGRRVRIGDHLLAAKRILLSTGSSPRLPSIAGLEGVPYLTNQNVFELSEIPATLGVIGGGPLGLEMAQAFQRLGSQVTVLQHGDEIMPRDDPELVRELRGLLEQEGIKFVLNAEANRVEQVEELTRLFFSVKGQEQSIAVERLLIATGRTPNTTDMGLEAAGVQLDRGAVKVDSRMRTTQPGIYAAGDITGQWQFSHIAEMEATVALGNAVLGLPQSASYRAAGWTTFTDPELASCGHNEVQAREQGLHYSVHRAPFSGNDRARTEQQGRGQVKVIANPITGKIYGAQILGPRAGELIQEFVSAMSTGVSLPKLSRAIHFYPTLSLANARAEQAWWQGWGDKPTVRRALKGYLRLKGFALGGEAAND